MPDVTLPEMPEGFVAMDPLYAVAVVAIMAFVGLALIVVWKKFHPEATDTVDWLVMEARASRTRNNEYRDITAEADLLDMEARMKGGE